MTELKLYGGPHSSFVRTTRMALEERGVPYTLVPCPPGHSEGAARHPFGKIPFMRYGDFVLAESIAIIRFAERTFPPGAQYGPSLWPVDSREAAVCDQWVSAVSDSVARGIGSGSVSRALRRLSSEFRSTRRRSPPLPPGCRRCSPNWNGRWRRTPIWSAKP